MFDHLGVEEVIARAIFKLVLELRRREKTLGQRMTKEFVACLADDEVYRTRLHPIVGARVEEAVRRGEDAARPNQGAGTQPPSCSCDDINAANRGPRPLVG
jgi:hypothetical protein